MRLSPSQRKSPASVAAAEDWEGADDHWYSLQLPCAKCGVVELCVGVSTLG